MKTLAQLNKEVWEEYEKTKKPVCQYIARNGYEIVQCECNGANGTTYVHLEDDLHTDIVINWQALGISIYVAKVTDKVIKFLIDEIFLVEDPLSVEMYSIFFADGTTDSLESFLEDTHSQVLPQTIVESVLDETINAYEDSIDKRIFIVCCQIAKSFKYHNALDADHFDIICRTAYQNFTKQDSADGYSCADLIERIRANIRQIIYFPSYNLDWDKVGYTNEQRARSLETRRSQMIERQRVVQSYLHNNNKMTSVHLSQRALARLISKETGYNARTVLEDIRSLTSQEAVKMSKKRETVEHSSSYLSYNNNKMYTMYTDDVQTLTCKQWCEKYNKSRSLYYKYKHKENK